MNVQCATFPARSSAEARATSGSVRADIDAGVPLAIAQRLQVAGLAIAAQVLDVIPRQRLSVRG